MRTVDWYFDFISPFAYIAFERLHTLPADVRIQYRPVLFAALLDHWGQKGPAEIAPKRQWTFRWCTWLAQQHGITLRAPAVHPFNPLPYLRLCLAADCNPDAIRTIYRAIWTTGADPESPEQHRALADSLGIDPARTADPAIKQALRDGTASAAAAGVFGVPTLRIDGELFWGVDGMAFAADFIRDPAVLDSPGMRAIDALREGSVRRGARGPAG
ncbi:2-hydroxychromene-2-carboxylate isomerase [Algiphilus sp.]|uniref:2-hydroxychromene-2-carboxylate isomerase n=1 Tax=Algiphilus sp. TaxID=1872431 RepID=UPI003C5C54E4